MTTQTYTGTLIVKTCPVCGVVYGKDQTLDDIHQERGGDWYCTSGHSLHYIETENKRLKRDLQTTENRLKAQREHTDRVREDRDRERRHHSATKGQLTKTKKRIANGVCPCCSRTFSNVVAHMTSQHPDYVEQAAT